MIRGCHPVGGSALEMATRYAAKIDALISAKKFHLWWRTLRGSTDPNGGLGEIGHGVMFKGEDVFVPSSEAAEHRRCMGSAFRRGPGNGE